jgi:Protein of unknown function (DUF5818)
MKPGRKKLGQFTGLSMILAAALFLLAPYPSLNASASRTSALGIAAEEVAPSASVAASAAAPADDPPDSAATFQGKIVSLNGHLLILRDEANDTWYHLDDQKTAAQFVGKQVTVTGVLDARSDVIRVRSIRESA